MKRYLSLSLMIILLFSFMTPRLFGQTANEILEKMIEAYGGRKALENAKDTSIQGTMEMIQMGISGNLTIYQKEPDKMRIDIEVMGMVITQAFDGEKAWWFNPQTGMTEEMPENAAVNMKQQSLGNDSLLHPEKYGITYTVTGREKLQDKEYFVLEQAFANGQKATLYIDMETYLPYKQDATSIDQSGVEVPSETFFGDYRKEGDLITAHSMTVYQGGAEFMKMTFTQFTLNSGLEDDIFKMK
ncbi:MAG: hypothetical protein WCC06_05210 [Candidatus Aminicenantales bacterium]